MWTTSWCRACKTVSPLLHQLITEDGVGEREGGVGYVEVELDSTTIGDLPMRYLVTSTPSLLAFSRAEPQLETRINRPEQLKDRAFLTKWIETEAQRGGAGGAGGTTLLSRLFGR